MITSEQVKQFIRKECKVDVVGIAPATPYSEKDKKEKSEIVLSDEGLSVLRWLYRFPEVVEQAAEELSPNRICTYLFELAGRYNSFYSKHNRGKDI